MPETKPDPVELPPDLIEQLLLAGLIRSWPTEAYGQRQIETIGRIACLLKRGIELSVPTASRCHEPHQSANSVGELFTIWGHTGIMELKKVGPGNRKIYAPSQPALEALQGMLLLPGCPFAQIEKMPATGAADD